MVLARAFWSIDTAIGRLPAPLANLAAGLLVAGAATVYAYLATGQWLNPRHRKENP